jgi:phosphatidylinositol glycan class M
LKNNFLWSVGGLHYTDIDYYVYSDAADLVLNDRSPYELVQYKYPPLIAMLLTWNTILGVPEFGKIIFSLFDIMVGVEIYKILSNCSSNQATGVNNARLCTLLWMVNPIAINIATRGSSG